MIKRRFSKRKDPLTLFSSRIVASETPFSQKPDKPYFTPPLPSFIKRLDSNYSPSSKELRISRRISAKGYKIFSRSRANSDSRMKSSILSSHYADRFLPGGASGVRLNVSRAAGPLVKKRTSSFSDNRGHNYLRTSLVLLDMHIRHVPLFSPSCRCKVTQPTYEFFFFFPSDSAHEGFVEFLLQRIVRFDERSFAKKKKNERQNIFATSTIIEESRDFCDEC